MNLPIQDEPKNVPVEPMDREQGTALIVTVVFLMMFMGGVLAVSGLAQLNTQRMGETQSGGQLLAAARSGVAAARIRLWENFQAQGGLQTKAAFRAFLLNQGLDPETDPTGPGDGIALATNYISFNYAGSTAEGVTIAGEPVVISVDVTRQDSADSTFLSIVSRATSTSGSRVSEVVLRAGGAPFVGFEFALLANNVNCIMCHANFDNVTRAYPGMGAADHDRIKVAALESLMIREGKADTKIAGTLYVNGLLYDKNGIEKNQMPGGAANIQSTAIDAATGKIPDTGWGTMYNLTDGMPSPSNPGGNTLANFYKDYDQGVVDDGQVPLEFPPVVPDGGDKILNDQEWSDHVDGLATGTLTGGTKLKAAVGAAPTTFSGGLLPRDGSGVGYDTATDGKTKQNMVLVGTKNDPIVLDGDVAIDGDVVISGYVQGTGQILARGNMYIVGDIIYKDAIDANGDRIFGEDSSGNENTLALAAGGNMIHGDYNNDKNGNIINGNGDEASGTDGGFTMSEIALFNRSEYTKASPFLKATSNPSQPQVTDDVNLAVLDSNGDPVLNNGWKGSAGTDGIAGTADDVKYDPRYYTFNPIDGVDGIKGNADDGKVFMYTPDPGFNKKGKATGVYWDNAALSWKGKEHGKYVDFTEITTSAGASAQGASLNPAGNWISQASLQAMYKAEDAYRASGESDDDKLTFANAAGGGAYEVNALMYTNNAIFMLARKSSSSGGLMTVNGAIVSSDAGILVGAGLTVNYDQKVKAYLRIEDTTSVGLTTMSRRER